MHNTCPLVRYLFFHWWLTNMHGIRKTERRPAAAAALAEPLRPCASAPNALINAIVGRGDMTSGEFTAANARMMTYILVIRPLLERDRSLMTMPNNHADHDASTSRPCSGPCGKCGGFGCVYQVYLYMDRRLHASQDPLSFNLPRLSISVTCS